MQLVDGESLDDRLAREKKLPLREVVRIGMQAAHGLAAAHAQGLIHRDIKPGNILLEPPGDRIKLTDFGLARIADDVKLTRTGFVTGTPLYMAPEQALGEEPDRRSDLFSLGAILYEMCAGEPPFKGSSALMILRQITESKHRPLREVDPSLPDWLTETIERLLAKKPADRIQSAAQLAELFDFEWALMKTTSEDVPTVCQEEERRATRRHRVIAVAVGATFLAVGLLGGWFLASRQPAAPGAVSSAEPAAMLSGNAGAVWSVSFNAQNDTLAMAVEDGSVRLWDLPNRSVRATLNAHRGTVWSTAFSHQGNMLVTAGDDGAIKIWELGQTEPVKSLSSPHSVRSIVVSNDDQLVYSGDRNGELRVFPIAHDGEEIKAQQPGSVHVIALSPNGETLATGGSDKIVRLWNAKTLSQRLPLEAHNGPIYGLSFNANGDRLASVGWDKNVRIWDVASGQLLKSWEAHTSDIWTVAFSTAGNQLVTGGTDGAVKLWNSETGELLDTFLGHNIAVHMVAFSDDGRQIASGGRDGNVRIWNLD
jgi:WD40 repeat protein